MSDPQSGESTATERLPATPANAWGQPISQERAADLQSILDAWTAPHANRVNRRGPFDREGVSDAEFMRLRLTGADVLWIAARSRRAQPEDESTLPLQGANLFMADLTGANLGQARLEGADLVGARLDRASLNQAHLEGASLSQANLEDANLSQAYLAGASLGQARLERANFSEATLEDANLSAAHLEGANLTSANMEGANIRKAWLDSKTMLRDASFDGRTRLGDIQWSGVGAVNLTQINWEKVPALGDEHGIGLSAPASDHQAVVRAYRQLASQLRSQGLTEVADRFAYRANLRQRGLYLRRFNLPQYLGSLLLDLISGYGYRPARSLITYILVILAFAGGYLLNAQFAAPHLTWDEALVLSISSFHGRGFFTTGISLSDTLARLAAGEAIVGLLIEITFIATFTQRFFAR